MSANEPREPKQGSENAGSQGQQQGQPGQGSQQMGEGSYAGTKQYNEGLKKHMNQHDIEKEALDAAPKTDEEAGEMQEAERIGRSKSRGEGEKGKGA